MIYIDKITSSCRGIFLILVANWLLNMPAGAEISNEATKFTKEVNAKYLKKLPFNDKRDFIDAMKDFIAFLVKTSTIRIVHYCWLCSSVG